MRDEKCLDVSPLSAWLELEKLLLAKNRFDPQLAAFRNYYVSGAHECQLDSQGRILVPQLLRDYAGLGREAMFTGDIDKFRIWDKDAWQQVFAADEQAFLDDPERWTEIDV